MRSTLIAALIASIAAPALAQHQSPNIQSTRIIYVDPAALDTNDDTRRDQVRYHHNERATTVAEQDQSGQITWANSDRERLGGQNAPARILVRAFDAVFAIDPFIELPQGDATNARILFNGPSLETDRALYNRIRIERTEELLRLLEAERRRWLRDNGYYGVRAFTNPNPPSDSGQDSAELPEPAGSFRVPADIPRGKSREQVNAAPDRAESIASSLLASDEPVRISLPMGVSADLAERVAKRNARAEQAEQVASNE
jgi:hypothetical protein